MWAAFSAFSIYHDELPPHRRALTKSFLFMRDRIIDGTVTNFESTIFNDDGLDLHQDCNEFKPSLYQGLSSLTLM